jgi:hypothetical protein
VTGEWGYVTGLSMTLGTTAPGYISASCPAPKGFQRAPFALLRSGFAFAGGVELSSTLNRSCKVAR